MIDHLLGRPSESWKRTQVFLVMLFWVWRLRSGSADGPRLFWLRRINRILKRFSPWQIIVGVLTSLYVGRHLDSIFGFGSPEPLARLYSRSYYRATWLATGLDAGFATAMNIQPKWIRDIASMLFSVYYVIYANEADEKLRKFRAVCAVEMLRTTWEKTTNPYIRIFNAWDRPRVSMMKKILISRPSDSATTRPGVGWLFFNGSKEELSQATDLILDLPGGGFICMSPLHHEERLRRWAIHCKRPVLSIDYGKAPEYPYPYAIEECFDIYRTLVDTQGRCLGMSGRKLNIIMTGDSAGGNLVATTMYKILEHPVPLPRPVALVLCYAALDFNFTSWMSPAHLRVLRSEQSSANLAGVAEQKDHYSHKSPLAVIDDTPSRNMRKRKSWTKNISFGHKGSTSGSNGPLSPTLARTRSMFKRKSNPFETAMSGEVDETGNIADEEDDTEDDETVHPRDKPLMKRVMFTEEEIHRQQQAEMSEAVAQAQRKDRSAKKAPIGTRLTMTSRTGYFQDRIISPSMMRAMAILYIGPKQNPDFQTDYYVSPILGPSALLAQFPPVLMTCGEKDPFVDDTVIFAGRIREAKRTCKVEQSAKNTRIGDGLRMLSATESEEDWVRLAIIEGWSHGFLQMSTLMPEARDAIFRIGDWINAAFSDHVARDTSAGTAESNPDSGLAASSETETDEAITFVPKRKRSRPPSFADGKSARSLGDQRGRSSDETLIEGATHPVISIAKDSMGRDDGNHEPTSRGQHHGTPPRLLMSDVLTGSPIAVVTPSLVGIASGSTPRPGTPSKVGALVSEADLLKRRREEAVYGIGDVRTLETGGISG